MRVDSDPLYNARFTAHQWCPWCYSAGRITFPTRRREIRQCLKNCGQEVCSQRFDHFVPHSLTILGQGLDFYTCTKKNTCITFDDLYFRRACPVRQNPSIIVICRFSRAQEVGYLTSCFFLCYAYGHRGEVIVLRVATPVHFQCNDVKIFLSLLSEHPTFPDQ